MMFEFKHPKYYKELRMQYGPHKAISEATGTPTQQSVRPGPGLKLQAATHDLAEATGLKQQASSSKQQATSKPEPSSGSEASSSKHQA